MARNSSGRERATRHEVRARNYRRQAQALFLRDADLDCAGALMYESAKQCVNAVANLNGINPGPTGAKVRFVMNLAGMAGYPPNLLQRWNSAMDLHIYADREHLTQPEFIESWERAQSFIDEMLLICSAGP